MYPTVVESPRGEPVLVITDFAYGKYLGQIDVTFDGEGRAIEWAGDPLLLDATIEPDPDTTEFLEPFAQEVAAFANQPLGEAAVDLIGEESSCRFEECNLGNLLTDALLENGAAQGFEVAIQNGGGIRSSISRGPVTLGDVLQVLPFGNTVSTFGLTGADLLAALEHGVSEVDNPGGDNTGRFLQVAGLRFSYDARRERGDRVVDVEIGSDASGWEPIDEGRVYGVVSNNFARGGGDGFEILATKAIDPYDQGQVISDVVADYIRRNGTVSPSTEGRIRRIDG